MALDDDVEKNDDYKKIKEEVEKLKLDENKFREERVCMPNPKVIFDKACSLANKLSDDNDRFRLLHSLDKLVTLKEIKSELKESPSEKLENVSQKMDKIILEQ